MKLDILLPIYNEEKILAASAKLLFDYCQRHLTVDWQIILIINGSVDQSLAIAESLAQNNDKFKIISLLRGGKGYALKTALQQSTADIAVYMDIDLAVSLEALPPLIALVAERNFDLALGSRLLPESQIKRSWFREGSSQTYNRLASLLLAGRISDWQCGFKAINQQTIKTILPLVTDDRWFFDTELLAWANHYGFKIGELPVNWSENRYAVRRSKIRPIRDGLIFLKSLIKLKKRLKKHRDQD